MTYEGWLLALVLTIPAAGLALLIGRQATHAASYWPTAIGFTALPLCLAPFLPWLAASAPEVLEPIAPILVATQGLPGVGGVEKVEPDSAFNLAAALVGLWALGALWRAGVEFWRSSKLSQVTAGAELADRELEERVMVQARALGVRPAAIYVHQGPVMVTGLVHSRLYLDAAMLTSAAFDQIIRHELAHIRRHDVLALSAARILGVVLWFNLFLFAIEARRRLAAELECDRLALAGNGDSDVRLYARALLDAAGSNSGSSPVVGFGVAPRKAIKMRMTSILSPTPKSKARVTLARLLALGAAVAMLGSVQAAQASGSFGEPEFTVVILEGRDTSAFGPRVIEGMAGTFHRGHDIAAAIGTPIQAPTDGRVIYVGDAYNGYPAWGHTVQLDHGGGWTTLYAHLDASTVSEGDLVRAGEVFATVGNSGRSLGPHLHVEVAHKGEFLNPAEYLPGLASPAN